MRGRNVFFANVGAALLLSGGLASAQTMNDVRDRRFTERDTNRDGYLSQTEYGGHPGNFRNLDRNGDGRLSHSEFVERGGADSQDGKVITSGRDADLETFERMDRNDDNIVSRGEWTGDTATFNRLDRTDDGRVTRDEYLNPLSLDTPEGRLQNKDRNNDGVLTRSEWRDETIAFDQADRNRDGRVNLNEYRNLPALDENRFAELDSDRDGVLVRREWPRGEALAFDDADRDGDGAVTRQEFQRYGGDGQLTDFDGRLTNFQDLDDNRDGYLSTREWPVDNQTFDLLDANNDNRISRAEFGDRNRMSDRFRRLDRDGDGVIERNEWTGSRGTFNFFDRNNDGVLSRSEISG